MIKIKLNELFTYNGLLFKSIERGFTCENCHFLGLNDYNCIPSCRLRNDTNNKVINYCYYFTSQNPIKIKFIKV